MDETEGGHAYVEHLRQEHVRINELVLRIGHEVDELSQAGQPKDCMAHLAQRLTNLRQQMQSHFAEEEKGGCLEEAMSLCPSLSGDGQAILTEHPLLDGMLEQILSQTRNPAVPLVQVQHDYREFAERLQAHEEAENRLLKMAFGSEAAEYGVEGED